MAFGEMFLLMRHVVIYDQPQGDAQYLANVTDNAFHFLYSSHCIEHFAMRPLNAGDPLDKMCRLNLCATFSGHWHGLNEQRIDCADVIASSCCARIRGNRDGSPLKGWWVCQAAPDGTLRHRFVSLTAEKSEGPTASSPSR